MNRRNRMGRALFFSLKGRTWNVVALVIAWLCSGVSAQAAPIVHPGDTLSVEVANYAGVVDEPDLTKALNAGTVVVAADGSISLPVVGTLNVSGKSTSAVAKSIEKHLASAVREPSVTVRLIQQGQIIFLTGATVGTLSYIPGETVASALGQLRQQFERDSAQALTPGDKYGGVLYRSAIDLRNIRLERDGRIGSAFDGEALLRSGSPGARLEPGDTLRFASKPVRVNVSGQVATPGPIYLYPTDTLETALLAAGGPLPSASTADSSLMRDGVESPLPLAGAALRQTARNGDTLVVRAAPHVTVLGQVPNPGELMLKNGTSLLSALYVAGGPTKWANVRDVQVVHNGSRQSYDLSGLQHGDVGPTIPLVDGDVVYVPEGHKIDAALFFQGLVGALAGAYNVTHL